MTETGAISRPIIRAAAVLIENGRICLVKQRVTETRHWALPGGKLELGERISECVTREFEEETGLTVRFRELLYMTDRIIPDQEIHLVHMSFLVDRVGDEALPLVWNHDDPFPTASSDKIREVRMVPVDELNKYGFPPAFCGMVKDGFPGRGSYRGDFRAIYGE